MAVPVKIADLNTTESSNSPSGSESVGVNLDNYLRAAFAILKQTQSKGSDIASGSTITIPDNGNYFVVTGTTTIGAINDSFNGRISVLKFSGALTLTDSTGLILFGADITTAGGDVLTVVNESAGVYRAISFFQAASGYTTLTGTETLTNKTIVAANNTITTAASGNLEATELDAALAELEAEITANIATLALKAPLASPTLTGSPLAPTAAPDTNNTQIATTAYVDEAVGIDEDSVGETELSPEVVPLGVGQTWQDLTASRVVNTEYTNSTGRPIQLSWSGVATPGYIIVDGVNAAYLSATQGNNITAIIPASAVYQVQTTGATQTLWSELR